MRSRALWWWTGFVVILLIALSLRLQKLTRISLTNDEVAEVTWAAMPFGAMLDRVAVDMVHPPLDYVVQFALGRAGAPEWARRLPSVLFGVATVALAIFLGRAWWGPLAGLLSGFFLAIAPLHIRFSQEIRPYSMALFFTAAAIAALEMYARRRRIAWAIVWFLAVFLAGFSFYFAGMTAGVVSLARIFIDRKETLANLWHQLPLIIAGWAALYAAWVPVAIRAVRNAPGFEPDILDWPWWRLRLQAFGAGDIGENFTNLGTWAFWCAVVIGIVLSVRVRSLRLAVVWLAGCGAIEIIALHYRPHYSAVRHLMPAWPGAFILAGAGVAFLLRRAATAPIGATIAIVFSAYSGMAIAQYYRAGRPDWRHVAVFVHERMRPGDTIIVTNNWVERNLGYYWERMPRVPDTRAERFAISSTPRQGPIWIVSGQCTPRDNLKRIGIVRQFLATDIAEVRYVRPGQTLDVSEELCSE
jgi:4-amino-4-deoxy-L-arabinose transferase-like glycosyltransferase